MSNQINVCTAIIVKDGYIYLQQRQPHQDYAGCWETPGGKAEAGESLADAVVRELREELGVGCVSVRPFHVSTHDLPRGRSMYFESFIVAIDGEPQAREGHRWEWVPLPMDTRPLSPGTQAHLAVYFGGA